ncbi:MAG: c-type cytochrome [Kaistella sp.]|nr:c-type cytochrome [Kaistella sp.]
MKQRTPVYVTIAIILVILFILYYMFVQNSSFIASPYFWGTVIITVILAMIQNALGDLIENDQFKKLTDLEKAEYIKEKNTPYFKRLYESAFKKQSATEEKDILIDHGFDGIMELDNQLPKWWLGLFWFGVAYCVIYMASYFLTDFADQKKEYDEEYIAQTASVAAYMETVPQATIETAVYKEDEVEAGKIVFQTNCVSCHGEGGKGGIGPNLTDKFWINQPEKTLFKNVFNMVENGSPNNPAMQAWGKNGVVSGNEIQQVSAYVYYINQVEPPITPAQGGAVPQGPEVNWEK